MAQRGHGDSVLGNVDSADHLLVRLASVRLHLRRRQSVHLRPRLRELEQENGPHVLETTLPGGRGKLSLSFSSVSFFWRPLRSVPPPPPPPPIPLHWLPVFFFRARCSCEHGLTDSSLKNVNTRVPCMFCAPDLSLAFGLKSVRLVGSELWTRCFFPEARTWGAGFQITHMGCGFGEGGGGYRHADNRYWPSWKAPGARGPFCEQMVCVDHLGVVGERGGLPANRWYAFIIVGGVRGGGGGASGEPALRFARVFV